MDGILTMQAAPCGAKLHRAAISEFRTLLWLMRLSAHVCNI